MSVSRTGELNWLILEVEAACDMVVFYFEVEGLLRSTLRGTAHLRQQFFEKLG